MAQIIPCDGPHPEPTVAVFIVTMITEAETMGLCAGCACDWSQALLTELAPERLAKPPAPAAAKSRRTRAAAQVGQVGDELAQAAADATG